MQPYFLPYLGYFKLMHEVDIFVLFDNAQMTKRSWIVRNKFRPFSFIANTNSVKQNPITISLPIAKKPRHSLISEQQHVVDHHFVHKTKKRLHSWYPNSSYKFSELLNDLFDVFDDSDLLVNILERQLKILSSYMRIKQPKIMRSSEIMLRSNSDQFTRIESAQDYIVQLCLKLEAKTYVNLPGGRLLYNSSSFVDENISLKYINFKEPIELTPMLSALHYAYFQNPSCMELINQFWSISNG